MENDFFYDQVGNLFKKEVKKQWNAFFDAGYECSDHCRKKKILQCCYPHIPHESTEEEFYCFHIIL